MRMLDALKQRVGKYLLERTMRGGIDLRKLRFLPDAVTLPFKRDGIDPVPEMSTLRDAEPVSELATLFGRKVWLVSGYDEAREALADGAS